MGDERIKLPSLARSTPAGDECSNGDVGEVFLRVNGIRILDISAYVPRNDDIVEVGFGAQ